mgnify:CR=1 FL=1
MIKSHYQGSIKNRLIAIIMLVTGLTSLIGYSSFVYWYMGNQYDRALNLSQTVGLVLGQDIAKLILLNDVSAAADISSELKSFSTLNSMVLFKKDSKAILQYHKDNKGFQVNSLPTPLPTKLIIENSNLKLYLNAMYQNKHLGFIELNFKVESIYDVIKKDINVLLFILFFICTFSYFLAIYFAKRFTEPILKLVKFLEKIDVVESLEQRIQTKENNEYGKLYDEVNTMLERISDTHQALKIAAVSFETQSGMTITDKHQNILRINKAFTDITGYTKEDTLEKTPKILKSGLHDKSFYDEMYNSLRKNHFWMGEINNLHKDGSIVNEHLTIHAVLDDNEEIIYYVASFLDITKQKEAEAKLKEKEQLLIQQSKMALMGEMLENIAHQWRQPLSLISTTSTGMVVKKELEVPLTIKEDIEQLNTINEASQYLSQTIDDFRQFFKTNKEKQTFNIKQSYYRTLNLTNAKFKSFDIKLIEQLDDVNICNIENELIQVMMNIMNNAKDVLQEKEEQEKLIFISLTQEDNCAIFSIKDNAGGIDTKILPKIFDPYFSTKKDAMGTGIGLYMSKEIVEKHMKGKLVVENTTYTYNNTTYKGANFSVILPL